MTDVMQAECPNCFAHLRVKGQQAIGKKVRCPKCQKPFVIQAPEPEEPADDLDDDYLSALDSAAASPKRQAAPPARVPRRVGARPKKKKADEPPKISRRSAPNEEEEVDRLGFIGWIVGGVIGGGFGAIIWASIGYSVGIELGWIAWGVGALAGIGVRMGASEAEGNGPGLTALVLAIVSVLFGKFLVAWFICDHFNKMMNENFKKFMDPEMIAIQEVRESVIADFKRQGRKPNAEFAAEDESGEFEDDKAVDPAGFSLEEVEREAKKRWDAKSPEEQAKAKEEADAEGGVKAFGEALGLTPGRLFVQLLLSPWTLLWFLLAGGTAFKIGAGYEFGD